MVTRAKLSHFLSALLLSAGLIATPVLAAGPADHKHDQADAPVSLSLDAGKKWATDQPLRKAMTNTRNALDAALHDIHENKFSAARYGALAKKISGEVNYMVSNCKLAPTADAQLHLIIADMLEGVEAMERHAKQARRVDGAVKVLGALENYGSYFDHPGWKPIKH